MRKFRMPQSSTPTLRLQGAVATITLNRPKYKNRLHGEDLEVLRHQFESVHRNQEIRILLLRANTAAQNGVPVFCSGFHLGELDSSGSVSRFEAIADALEEIRPVTIGVLSGSVYGGATDLALACDFRVGALEMEFRMPAAAIGLHYYAGGMARYLTRLGLGAAKRAFLTAQTIDAATLLSMGYLDELHPPDMLEAVVEKWVNSILPLSPMAVTQMKQSLNGLARNLLDLDGVRRRQLLCEMSDDFDEGRRAVAEKRKPNFSGK